MILLKKSMGGVSDHTLLSNIGTNTHVQIDTHIALVNEHIDWINASQNFLTTGSLGSGDATINGFLLIDDTHSEALLIRKNGDTGDIFIADTSGNNILIGDRSTPALVRLEWRDRYSPVDTTTGVEWSASGHKIIQDAIAWEYKSTFFGFSAASPINFLLQASPSGFTFNACYNDAKSSYLPVGIMMKGYGNTDNLLGTWYFNVDDSTGDLSFRYAYSGSNILIFDNATKNLKIPDGVDFIIGATNGTIYGDASSKQGWFGHAAVTQRLKANYNNWAAFTDIVDALVDLGFFDQA